MFAWTTGAMCWRGRYSLMKRHGAQSEWDSVSTRVTWHMPRAYQTLSLDCFQWDVETNTFENVGLNLSVSLFFLLHKKAGVKYTITLSLVFASCKVRCVWCEQFQNNPRGDGQQITLLLHLVYQFHFQPNDCWAGWILLNKSLYLSLLQFNATRRKTLNLKAEHKSKISVLQARLC